MRILAAYGFRSRKLQGVPKPFPPTAWGYRWVELNPDLSFRVQELVSHNWTRSESAVFAHEHQRWPGQQLDYRPAPSPKSNENVHVFNPLRGKYQRKSFEVSVIQGQHLVLGSVKSEDPWSQVAINGCTSVWKVKGGNASATPLPDSNTHLSRGPNPDWGCQIESHLLPA